MRCRTALLLFLVHVAAACDGEGAGEDAATDGGVADAGRDALVPSDGGDARDGSTDAGSPTVLELALRVEGNGTIGASPPDTGCGRSCVLEYAPGTEVTLTATPRANSRFVAWSGDCEGQSPSCTVTLTRPLSVGASFASEEEEVTLRVEASGDGMGVVRSAPPGLDCAPPCEASFPRGTRVSLVVAPAYRSTMDGWDEPGCGGACVLTLDADRTITARIDRHPFVRLSDVDRDPYLRLRDDGLAADFHLNGGARSIQSVAPGSGVFYFEARFSGVSRELHGFGIATAAAPVTMTWLGETDQSYGVEADGSLVHDGAWLGSIGRGHDRLGMVVDYRGTSPIVYVIALAADGVSSEVRDARELTSITAPVHIFVAGLKRDTDYVIEIEPGNDTTTHPFELDPRGALRALGLGSVASRLVLGFGDTYAGPRDTAPSLVVPGDRTVTAGGAVTLTASAIDAEDGDLSAQIEWELLSSPHYGGRARATGPTFSFTPSAIGLHPARARVRDHAGNVREATVRVRVPGPVVQHDPVRLVRDALSSPGAELSADGLRARWIDLGKYGLRANQALYGEFWYFEITRLVPPANQGGGLVAAGGNIAPYTWDDVPGSCSVNMLGGVWRDLIWQRDFPRAMASYTTVGFAVDYRGENPIVYVVADGEVVTELVLADVWIELHPMIYGNPTGLSASGEHDAEINFGASPFVNDPVAALGAYGADASALEVGWGDANTTPP